MRFHGFTCEDNSPTIASVRGIPARRTRRPGVRPQPRESSRRRLRERRGSRRRQGTRASRCRSRPAIAAGDRGVSQRWERMGLADGGRGRSGRAVSNSPHPIASLGPDRPSRAPTGRSGGERRLGDNHQNTPGINRFRWLTDRPSPGSPGASPGPIGLSGPWARCRTTRQGLRGRDGGTPACLNQAFGRQ